MVKTLELDTDANVLLKEAKRRTDVNEGALASKAIRYYVPRMLRGEAPLIEPEAVQVEPQSETVEARH